MKKANEQLKGRLDKELEQIQFSSQHEVLNRVNRLTWKGKLHQLWNKEITIPLVPVSTAFVLLVAAFSFVELKSEEQSDSPSGVIIQIAGNHYWEDDLERVTSQYEN